MVLSEDAAKAGALGCHCPPASVWSGVFLTSIRFRRMTQRGPVWFVEAMFPGYLFAKFVYSTQHRAVENSHGIRGIVHFGDRLATLPENVVTALQSRVGSEEVVTLDCSIKVGQSVQIIDGPFQG